MAKRAGKRPRYGLKQGIQIARRLGIGGEEKALRKAARKIIPRVAARKGIRLDPETISRIEEGALNYSFSVKDAGGKEYFMSIARRNPGIMRSIIKGYVAFGFNRRKFGFRSMREQHRFMEFLREQGFSVPRVVAHGLNYFVREFSEGVPLNGFLAGRKGTAEGKRQTAEAVSGYLNEIMRAHSKGIVFGDRDGTNTLVKKDRSVEFFDFDIKHRAPDSLEFEVAQAMYFCIVYSKNKGAAVEAASSAFRSSRFAGKYSLERVLEFLRKRGAYYRGDPRLGLVERETLKLVGSLGK